MLKALVKKQLTEIFRMYFYDQKKSKARSKASTVILLSLFMFLMFGVLGGMFGYFAYSMRGILQAKDMAWFYFALLGLLSTLFGVFGSVFNTFSSLYLAKDNDLILSMPIPIATVVLSRLIGVYLIGALYSCTLMIPALVVFFIYGNLSVASVAGAILLTVLVTLFVFVLSCLLGYIVAKISVKLKNKSFITVLVSLAFIAVYYFVYYKANDAIMALLLDIQLYGNKVKDSAYPIYLFGRMGEGDLFACLIYTLFIVALMVITWALIKRGFIKTATSTSITVTKSVTKEDKSKSKSVFGALLWKEFKRFTSSPQYMLNCGLGVVLMPAAAIFMIVSKEKMVGMLMSPMSPFRDVSSLIVCAILMFLVSSIDVTAPSVSLEGKHIWIAQSLPVTPWQFLKAKLCMQLILSVVPTLLCSICAVYAFEMSKAGILFVIIIPLLFCVFNAMFGLMLGITHPNLTWTSEIIPIKQSFAVIVSVFGCWAISAAFAGIYFLFDKISLVSYLIVSSIVFVLIILLMYYYLKNHGAKKFASL